MSSLQEKRNLDFLVLLRAKKHQEIRYKPMNNIDAVILAGGTGDTMYPLTAQETKHFLPIQGRPLISYSLDLVLDNFFKNVIIVVNKNNESKIHHYVHSKYKHTRRKQVKILLHVANEIHTLTEVISEMITQYKIQRDFMLLYGDVITNTPLTDFIDTHYASQNDITCGMLDKNLVIAASKKVKVKSPTNVDKGDLLVMYTDKRSAKLAYEKEEQNYRIMCGGGAIPKSKPKKKGLKKIEDMGPRANLENKDFNLLKIIHKDSLKSKGLSFKVNLFQQNQRVKMRGDLSQANVYMISTKVFPILVHLTDKFRSFSEELIPFIVDYQRNKKLLRYYGKRGALLLMRERQASLSKNPGDKIKSFSEVIKSPPIHNMMYADPLTKNKSIELPNDNVDLTDPRYPEWMSNTKLDENDQFMFSEYQTLLGSDNNFSSDVRNFLKSRSQRKSQTSQVKIGCHIFESFYKRVNSEKDYKQVTLEALGLAELFPLFGGTGNSQDRFQFSPEQKKKLGLGASYISSLTQFSDVLSCKIKNCFIGNGVKIGKNCILENSVILEGSDIGDGSVIRNSCIGANSLIQQECSLINIVLGEANLVIRGKKFEDDVLNMPQDNSNLLQPIQFVETRSSRKYSHIS